MQAISIIPEVQQIHKPVSERRNGHNVISFPDCDGLTTRDMLCQAISLHIHQYRCQPASITVSYSRFVETVRLVAMLPPGVFANDKCPVNEIWLEV